MSSTTSAARPDRGLRRRPRLPAARRGPVRRAGGGVHRLRQRHGDAHRGRRRARLVRRRLLPLLRGHRPVLAVRAARLGDPVRARPRCCGTCTAASSKEWSPLFVFHVDRNRLLMLTKDATAGLAAAGGAALPADHGFDGAAGRRGHARPPRPPCGPPSAAAVFGSYLRLLPRMLRRRRAIGRSASVSRPELEAWLVTRS